MPTRSVRPRSKPLAMPASTALLAAPSPQPAPQLPAADHAAGRAVLQVGDYEVGETFCPRLCGHPGIRY